MMDKRTLGRRVSKGIKLLDKVKPDWWKKIDLRTFDMGEANYCVLGQSFGNFFSGLKHLNLTEEKSIKYGLQASDMGFGNDKEYSDLAELWLMEIGKRQVST